MNPVKPQNSKWAEIGKHGLFGRQLEPVFQSNNRKMKILAAPVALALFGITIYWIHTYSGPYRYLAELQLKWFGYYSPELPAALAVSGLVFGLLGIAVAIKFLFRGAERRGQFPGCPLRPLRRRHQPSAHRHCGCRTSDTPWCMPRCSLSSE